MERIAIPGPGDMPDDLLLDELMYWVRVGRAESGLQGEEKLWLRAVSLEVVRRKLLKICK